jgi:hypothetical protein
MSGSARSHEVRRPRPVVKRKVNEFLNKHGGKTSGTNVPMELTRKNEKALQISSDAPTRSIFDVSEFKPESAMQPDTVKEAIDQVIKELDPK